MRTTGLFVKRFFIALKRPSERGQAWRLTAGGLDFSFSRRSILAGEAEAKGACLKETGYMRYGHKPPTTDVGVIPGSPRAEDAQAQTPPFPILT